MQFETEYIYHIYNQGNNRQRIFFSDENYLYFIEKMRQHLLPHCDILAWCLMPNHFHLMVRVNTLIIDIQDSDGVTSSHPVTKQRSFNDNIAILLRSYTRAINKQEKRTGSLFREATKAECLNKPDGITPAFFNTSQGTLIQVHDSNEDYPNICFNYIHQNPLKTKLVTNAEDWQYSSYRDVMGIRNGTLINRELINEFGLLNIVAY